MRTNVLIEDQETTAARLISVTDSGAAWLVGAGISGPSELPLAWNIKEVILSSLAYQASGNNELWLQNQSLWEKEVTPVMLEAILEKIRLYVPDIESKISEIFLSGKPTEYHFLIAKLLASGRVSKVFTTNFDTLIEQAWEIITKGERQLKVVVGPDDYLYDHSTLIKLHGCATQPESIAFTLKRVGQGLEKWKSQALIKASQSGLTVIGYSDRDKDISPIIAELHGEWLWLLYHGVSVADHIQEGSLLDSMLAKPARTVVWTNPLAILEAAFGQSKESSSEVSSNCDKWQSVIEEIIRQINQPDCQNVLIELLRDELNMPDEAIKLACSFLNMSDDLQKARLLLQINVVHGERWRMDNVRENLKEARNYVSDMDIPPSLEASMVRQEASLAQQDSIKFAIEAEELYAKEIELRRITNDRIGQAWATHNLAVTLHKQAKHEKAEPYFVESIRIFREQGQTQRIAQALVNYGSLLAVTGREKEAESTYREALENFFMLGHSHWVGRCKANLALNLSQQGKREESVQIAIEAAELLRDAGDQHWLDNLEPILHEG